MVPTKGDPKLCLTSYFGSTGNCWTLYTASQKDIITFHAGGLHRKQAEDHHDEIPSNKSTFPFQHVAGKNEPMKKKYHIWFMVYLNFPPMRVL